MIYKNTIEGKMDSLIKEQKKMNEMLATMLQTYIIIEGYKNGTYSKDFMVEMIGDLTKNAKIIFES